MLHLGELCVAQGACVADVAQQKGPGSPQVVASQAQSHGPSGVVVSENRNREPPSDASPLHIPAMPNVGLPGVGNVPPARSISEQRQFPSPAGGATTVNTRTPTHLTPAVPTHWQAASTGLEVRNTNSKRRRYHGVLLVGIENI